MNWWIDLALSSGGKGRGGRGAAWRPGSPSTDAPMEDGVVRIYSTDHDVPKKGAKTPITRLAKLRTADARAGSMQEKKKNRG